MAKILLAPIIGGTLGGLVLAIAVLFLLSRWRHRRIRSPIAPENDRTTVIPLDPIPAQPTLDIVVVSPTEGPSSSHPDDPRNFGADSSRSSIAAERGSTTSSPPRTSLSASPDRQLDSFYSSRRERREAFLQSPRPQIWESIVNLAITGRRDSGDSPPPRLNMV